MKELTGKAKEAFEKWYLKGVTDEENYDQHVINSFYRKSESMQWGVLVDFFESVGIYVSTIRDKNSFYFCVSWAYKGLNGSLKAEDDSTEEARRAAIEKATEIFNER